MRACMKAEEDSVKEQDGSGVRCQPICHGYVPLARLTLRQAVTGGM